MHRESMKPFLSIDDVNVTYGSFVALHSLSLAIQPGEFFCLLGPSGSGKTTALGVIAGFTDVGRGEVTLDGEDITHVAPQKRGIGVVFQSYALFPHMTANENIGYGLKVRGEAKDKIEKRAAELLSLVHLDGKGDRYPRQMSGGEQQRVAIARALAIQPRLMLLDEPLSNLDARLREEMRVELKRIQRATGVTTILVTHDQEEAFGIADRIAILNKGRLEQVGSPDDIYWSPQSRFVARFIGQANVLEGAWNAAAGRFRIGGHQFACARSEVGDGPAILFLRPEEIRIGGEPLANAIAGEVESVAALGSTLNVRINTAVGQFLVYRLSDMNQSLRPGDKIELSWGADHGRIMARDAT
jgi:putative spermidine/putrescine transport system ATP-binding protein